MFSQFFILNNKGETIIFKDYRFDISKDSNEIFFKHVQSMKSEITPAFNIDGINYLYIKKREMYFVFTTRLLVSPSLGFELLNRASKIIQDYTASLTEEAIRLNFILIYELLDELMDYGVPQSTGTETLKAFVFTPPKQIKSKTLESDSIIDNFLKATNKISVPPKQGVKPIHSGSNSSGGSSLSTATVSKVVNNIVDSISGASTNLHSSSTSGEDGENEIYIDLCERLTVLYSSNGTILRNEITGKIQMKSYLRGNPVLSLGLSSEFTFKTIANRDELNENDNDNQQSSSIPTSNKTSFTVDDCSFHECAGSGFQANNVINFKPPQGDFTLLKYRISNNSYTPFLVKTNLESTVRNRFDLVVTIRSNFSNKVVPNFIFVSIPVPKSTKSLTHSLDYGSQNQKVEYKQSTQAGNLVFWSIKKLRGGMETILRIQIHVDGASSSSSTTTPNQPQIDMSSTLRKEIGPIGLEFSIPQFSCSTLQIKFLKMLGSNISPIRWIRYITDSKSFVSRINN
ncbi:hypothetical protein RB653_003105 [Dictyostelium firmibasis]|uniref:MHD domain-containing protein n=1 Tax=Dictyostelium firmibasis TaxID=79012 RepID=A0AAN7YW61_9MYCE